MTTELNELRLHSAISWNKSAYTEQLPASVKFAPINECIESACYATGITREDFVSSKRQRQKVTARMLVSNYILKHYGYTLERIGEICGGKDHATILHYKKNFINLVDWKDQVILDALFRFNSKLLEINPNYKQL